MAYQLTSMLMPGAMIVVAPLVALINDQIENLSRADDPEKCAGIPNRA